LLVGFGAGARLFVSLLGGGALAFVAHARGKESLLLRLSALLLGAQLLLSCAVVQKRQTDAQPERGARAGVAEPLDAHLHAEVG